jgi:hypothetical protein
MASRSSLAAKRTEVSFSSGPNQNYGAGDATRGASEAGPLADRSCSERLRAGWSPRLRRSWWTCQPNPVAAVPALNPRLRTLLERAPPPPRGKAAVALVVSADSISVGEQVDVVTAAWFPRDLRLQLRRPPTLTATGHRWGLELSPVGARRHSPPPGTSPGAHTTCLWPTRWCSPLVAGTIVVPARRPQVQHPARPPVLQSGRTLCAMQSSGNAAGAPLPTAGRTRGVQRGSGIRTRIGAEHHASHGARGRRVARRARADG